MNLIFCVVLKSQMPSHSRSGSLDANSSVFQNEAVLLASLQQNRLHQPPNNNNQRLLSAPRRSQDIPLRSSSYTANLGLSASLYNSLNTLLSQAHSKQPAEGLTYPNYSNPHAIPRPLNVPFSSRITAQPQMTNNSECFPIPAGI